jgi:hypothetical protein
MHARCRSRLNGCKTRGQAGAWRDGVLSQQSTGCRATDLTRLHNRDCSDPDLHHDGEPSVVKPRSPSCLSSAAATGPRLGTMRTSTFLATDSAHRHLRTGSTTPAVLLYRSMMPSNAGCTSSSSSPMSEPASFSDVRPSLRSDRALRVRAADVECRFSHRGASSQCSGTAAACWGRGEIRNYRTQEEDRTHLRESLIGATTYL